MHRRGDFEFLSDIEEAIKRIENYTVKMSYQDFFQDIKTQDAVIRNLEIIGEAVKNLSDKLKKKHTDVDWKNMAGMRNKIIHFYFGVNWEIVWDVIQKRLPGIKHKIETILRTIENSM